MGKVSEVLQPRDLVVGDFEDTEVQVRIEARDVCQRVMRDVELFQGSEGLKAGYRRETVRLY